MRDVISSGQGTLVRVGHGPLAIWYTSCFIGVAAGLEALAEVGFEGNPHSLMIRALGCINFG